MQIERIDANRWRIPASGKMRVPGLVFASEAMMQELRSDQSLQQVANVAQLPGIVEASMAMPDIHWGYGFPIGGVAAFDLEGGVISPGGVGYDINCGVRVLHSRLRRRDLEGKGKALVDALFRNVPSGVGSHRRDLKLDRKQLRAVLRQGARWAVEHELGDAADLEHIEEGGCLAGADPDQVSERAIERGRDQLGTIGSGNHFVEVGYVSEIYDPKAAAVLGFELDQVTAIVHCGSRGLGYQVCDDYLSTMIEASRRYGIELPDRQLCCAPLGSPEAERYSAAMAAAANFAFCNREVIAHWVRQAFSQVFDRTPAELALRLVYDVCHNIAKLETHLVEGRRRRVCVHRKGATRAFAPGSAEIPAAYRAIGQPVLIPGDMGRYSYVLVGTQGAMEQSFGSTCHGAGRRMSRHQAKRQARGRRLVEEFEARGIYLRGAGRATIEEEIPEAYKDVAEVVDCVHAAGISKKVVQLKPLAVVKG
ncbi:MAG TPA: RtcB family protein [Acidobacteriota bacterium]